MEKDVYENVSFDGMKKVTVMFDERPSFSQIFARGYDMKGPDRLKEVVVVADAQLTPNEDGISRPVRGDFGASNPVVARRKSL
jgi:hypothetical protein